MPSCELCGKGGPLVIADIEGIELKVCSPCGRLGNLKKQILVAPQKRFVPQAEAPEVAVVDNFASLFRSAREEREMNQEEFAHFLNERESMVPKWESGQLKPDLDTAQRIGRKLGITLVEREEAISVNLDAPKKAEELTLGDFVKMRKRK